MYPNDVLGNRFLTPSTRPKPAFELLLIFSSGACGMETTSPLVERHCAHAPEISNIFCALSEGCAPLSNQATALSTFEKVLST